jgi:hypothetical protein
MQQHRRKLAQSITFIAIAAVLLSAVQAQAFYGRGRYFSTRSLQNSQRMNQQSLQAQAKQMQQMQKAYAAYEKQAQEAEVKRQVELKATIARRHERLDQEKQARIEKNKKHQAELAAKAKSNSLETKLSDKPTDLSADDKKTAATEK